MSMKRNLLVSLIILIAAACASAQSTVAPKLPDTEAGRLVAAYIETFNSGDEQKMRDFLAANVSPDALKQRPLDARLEVYRQLREGMGGLELNRVTRASDNSIAGLFHTKTGRWVEITFMLEAASPHKLVALGVEDAEPPSGDSGGGGAADLPASMSEKDAIAALEAFVNERVAADEFSGIVIVAKNGSPVFQKAYGLASRAYNVPNRLDTKFNLGSINKIFTQVAVGQLIEQGKLSLDDKLGKFLPDYPNRDAAEKVTVRELLSMTSGIGDFFGDKFLATPKDRLRTIKDYLPLFASEPLHFEPGTKNEYSNGGYVVLGAIIEKASGRDYYDYVRENIFKPTGMQNTDWYEADNMPPNSAEGYTREGAEGLGKNARRNNIYTRPARGSSAGGGYSTAEDLLKFSLALQSKKLRLADFRSGARGASVGAGAAQPNAGGFGGVGIAGGAPGVNAVLDIAGGDGYTIIVMSNYDPPSAMQVGMRARGLFSRVKAQ
jgi:CubicO group peptidase (beta-lactamase class C family)